jgi:hypothetical protein
MRNAPFSPGYNWNEGSLGNPNYQMNPMNDYSGLGGSLGNMFGMFMGQNSYRNPSDAASPYFDRMQNPANGSMDYFNQIPGAINPYLNPYSQAGQSTFPAYQNTINQGQNASNILQGQYARNINDPTSVMNQIGSNFQQSPGYNFQKQQMTNASDNAAAAGGFVGSPQAQQQMAQNIGGLANQDYWNYENHGLDQYNSALQGEQNVAQRGMGAMSDLAHMGYGADSQRAQQLAEMFSRMGQMQFGGNEDMMNADMSRAQLAYAGQQNRNENQGGFWGALGNLAGTALPFFI